jgi:hypothetical protein
VTHLEGFLGKMRHPDGRMKKLPLLMGGRLKVKDFTM